MTKEERKVLLCLVDALQQVNAGLYGFLRNPNEEQREAHIGATWCHLQALNGLFTNYDEQFKQALNDFKEQQVERVTKEMEKIEHNISDEEMLNRVVNELNREWFEKNKKTT